MTGEDTPLPHVAPFWNDVIADMEATAAEYREAGWETLELHPGDVAVLSPEQDDPEYGLDVLVAGNEFDELEALVEEGVSFDAYEVYRASESGFVLLVVAMQDEERQVAVFYPAYYQAEAAAEMLETAREAETMYSHLRTLSEGRRVTVTHEDPDPFFPEAETESGSESDTESETED